MKRIETWEIFKEGIDFEGNFTPLYNICSKFYLDEILAKDKIIIGKSIAKGPKGICVSRSKYFSHDRKHGFELRFILNKELLKKHGYNSYPVDEWKLSKLPNDKNIDYYIKNRKYWSNPHTGNIHAGKSNFEMTKNGKRPVHNNLGLPTPGKSYGLEVEYEERILKSIKGVGRFIYAINFDSIDTLEQYKPNLRYYLKDYPNIKILIGETRFKDVTNEIGVYTPDNKNPIINSFDSWRK